MVVMVMQLVAMTVATVMGLLKSQQWHLVLPEVRLLSVLTLDWPLMLMELLCSIKEALIMAQLPLAALGSLSEHSLELSVLVSDCN
jgi:hypothetical protein